MFQVSSLDFKCCGNYGPDKIWMMKKKKIWHKQYFSPWRGDIISQLFTIFHTTCTLISRNYDPNPNYPAIDIHVPCQSVLAWMVTIFIWYVPPRWIESQRSLVKPVEATQVFPGHFVFPSTAIEGELEWWYCELIVVFFLKATGKKFCIRYLWFCAVQWVLTLKTVNIYNNQYLYQNNC